MRPKVLGSAGLSAQVSPENLGIDGDDLHVASILVNIESDIVVC